MSVCLETSGIIAILLGEVEQPTLVAQLSQVRSSHCPATCVLEAAIVLVRKQKMTTAQAKELVLQLLADFDIAISGFDQAALGHAIDGYAAFGKGRGLTPAVLNFGDCLSYGAAKAAGGKLLFTGGDFRLTDLA
jgi:ribonuclease VapC